METKPKPSFIQMKLTEGGQARKGTDPHEVVVAISPEFAKTMNQTIVNVELSEVLRQVLAGIEEQGGKYRIIRTMHTADLAFMGSTAAKLSGSGIGIAIQSRGTAVIHQRDLAPLSNLELFPQAPVMNLETYRSIGRNAAIYASNDSPDPVPVVNDPMARPKYQAVSALLYLKESNSTDKKIKPMDVFAEFSI
ncbi:propanediol/glycerol family dehydratase medium subunit [Alteribacillus sp. JSM 102045]|uniref:propanediol/glycerol family dehydratase medium subunit n=1 Tax=Alteribacillus sp. JSM 102045 TaxID=1562101 RepID=UPI0035C04892